MIFKYLYVYRDYTYTHRHTSTKLNKLINKFKAIYRATYDIRINSACNKFCCNTREVRNRCILHFFLRFRKNAKDENYMCEKRRW